MNSPEEHGNGPVIHDHRRIDPVTGQVREPDRTWGKHAVSQPGGQARADDAGHRSGTGAEPAGSAPGPGPEAPADSGTGQAAEAPPGQSGGTGESKEMDTLKEQLAERTADLQRLQAEYANYRKRVDRDRGAMRELALANVLTEMLPALDAISQARQHDELSGGFKSVAETIESAVSKLGLVTYGEPGELFDPKVHEAVATSYSPDVTDVTCTEIFQPGYKVGDRILRPARVVVAEPSTGPDGVTEPGAQAQQDQDHQ
ncbi:MAG TPA: nucleotide exchange factor GrpE [Streptosporangiaceae bacterium]